MTSRSPEETFKYGKEYAARLKAGDIVFLQGDLGTGKTQFVKGICYFYNVKENVNSPTFIIVNEYTTEHHSEVSKIFHFDLYRLKKAEELKEIGLNEYFRNDSICLIEWPDILMSDLKISGQTIKFSHGSGQSDREIEILKN